MALTDPQGLASRRGFTLTELLAVLLIVSLVAAGIGSVFASQNRAYVHQDIAVALEENLRVSLATVSDSLRLAGCGAPSSDLDDWIPWVRGFRDAPVVVREGGDAPDELSVAACTAVVARLSHDAAAGSTTLSLDSEVSGRTIESLLNTYDKGLIWIGDTQHATVRALGGGAVTIDTDPRANGDQGLLRAFLAGTPVSRIDVLTFAIDEKCDGARAALTLDKHRGEPLELAEGVSDLQVVALDPGRHYRLTLSAESELDDPVTGQPMGRRVTSEVTLRN